MSDDPEVPQELAHSFARSRLFGKRQKIYRRLAKDFGGAFTRSMTIEHLMSKNPTSVLTSTSAEDVAEMIEKVRFRHLLVCDQRGKLAGIISDRDVMRQSCATAGEMMTPNPITLQPKSLVSLAVTPMINKHISCLPVVDAEGRPCAVVTTTDLIMALQCMMQILHSAAPDAATSDGESRSSQPDTSDLNPTEAENEPTIAIKQKVDSTT